MTEVRVMKISELQGYEELLHEFIHSLTVCKDHAEDCALLHFHGECIMINAIETF